MVDHSYPFIISNFNTNCGAILLGENKTPPPNPARRGPPDGERYRTPQKGEEGTVEPQPEQEQHPREGCLPRGGCREENIVSSDRQQRNRTTPEGIRHLSNLSEGGSGKGDVHGGLLNPSQGVTNTTPLVVDNTEHRRRAGLGRKTPYFNYRSPRTTYSGPTRNSSLLEKEGH